MDTILPGTGAGPAAGGRSAKSGRLRVRTAAGEHAVTELTPRGFVIAADGRPPLRGYADIFRGDERVVHGLVVCSWARDGQVGYEFKRGGRGDDVPADYVRPAHSRLLPAPGEQRQRTDS